MNGMSLYRTRGLCFVSLCMFRENGKNYETKEGKIFLECKWLKVKKKNKEGKEPAFMAPRTFNPFQCNNHHTDFI